MFNSTILDVAIGLAFTYLLLALICTTVNEWLSGITNLRGDMLAKGVAGLLQGQTLGDAGTKFLDSFKQHPLIRGLMKDEKTPPSYIPSRTFALAVLDLVTPQTPGPITFQDLQKGIDSLPAGEVKKTLLALIQDVHGDLGQAQARIEQWFNDAMDRVSGWYARNKQFTAFIISTVLVILANADTLAIANKLWVSPTLRQEIVSRAQANQDQLRDLVKVEYTDPKNPRPTAPATKQQPAAGSLTSNLQKELGDLAGWSSDWKSSGGEFPVLALAVAGHLPGWLLSIVAVSLGAPFWFDTLNRFMSVRSAKPPAEPPPQPAVQPVVVVQQPAVAAVPIAEPPKA